MALCFSHKQQIKTHQCWGIQYTSLLLLSFMAHFPYCQTLQLKTASFLHPWKRHFLLPKKIVQRKTRLPLHIRLTGKRRNLYVNKRWPTYYVQIQSLFSREGCESTKYDNFCHQTISYSIHYLCIYSNTFTVMYIF